MWRNLKTIDFTTTKSAFVGTLLALLFAIFASELVLRPYARWRLQPPEKEPIVLTIIGRDDEFDIPEFE